MDTPTNSTLEDDVKQLLTEVPPPVRAFFAAGKAEDVAKDLMGKYQLHIDQGAVMERGIILLLLGLESPAEFTQELIADAKLDRQVVDSIVGDVNTQIFIPLQEEIRKGFAKFAPPVPPTPAAPQARRPEIPGVKPEVRPGQTGSHFHLENKIPPPGPRPVPSAVPPRPASPAPTARPGLREALASATKASAVPDANRLLEDHEEPSPSLKATEDTAHIEFKKAPVAPAPAHLTPPPPPASPQPPHPHPAPPHPANLPGAMPPHVIPPGGRPVITQPTFGPAMAPRPAAGAPQTPTVPPAAPRPVLFPEAKHSAPPAPKAYTVDPYREPFDHEGG